ncbi:PREDICTED: prosaposin [Dufourea novaeangliae]|nr:PREDICTED: prosaposin [Dufourea novaeangliae]
MQIFIALSAILAVSTARVVINAEEPTSLHLLGEEECTWGPSYWCENIKTAAGCNATKHCIKTIWTGMNVPEDNDNVCSVCKDMVQQARDQLQSNQTQEDLKAVFEGSCRLIHVKPIVKECISIVDEFIPDLVETLASQMNPSVVCSVAGLCNSAHIDKLLKEYEQSTSKIANVRFHSLEKDEIEPAECTKCHTVAAHMEYKLNNTPRDQVLQQMLNLCTDLSSYTDACSAIILTYFDTMYAHLQENFNAQNICHLSGQCTAQFHKHEDTDKTPNVEIRPLSSVGMVDVSDDLPCKLCEQLVGHLRDLLVANTTEVEFRQVLDGFCRQTKSFSSECIAIVDEYYPQIYEYLTKGLNSIAVCQMSGICPAPGKSLESEPVWPLLPLNLAEISAQTFQESKKNKETEKSEELRESEIEAMQLPIDRMLPFPLSEAPVGGKVSCALCEYVLHYIQDALTNPTTDDQVKEVIEKVCKKLPGSIKGECTEFVDTYGDAIVAILAQEVDPSQVCPMLHLCPSEKFIEFWESVPAEYVLQQQKNKPSCPLCLLAVSQVYNVIKNDKTQANIEAALDKLCVHLPHSLTQECMDLVQGYSKELVELIIADLTPQEVCVFIKLCDPTKNSGPKEVFVTDKNGEILTNEIPDVVSFDDDMSIENQKSTTCIVCEFAMRHVDKALGNDKSKQKVEKVVHDVCKHLPKTISRECNKFVEKFAGTIIDIVTKDISPHQVCTFVGLCTLYAEEEFAASVTKCAVCKGAISVINELLGNDKVDNSIKNAVAKACKYLPASKQSTCTDMINIYGQSIINLIQQNTKKNKICSKIGLCAASDYSMVSMESSRIKRSYEKNRIKQCTWGPAYWCSSNETAHECKAVEHCKEHVWKADFAPLKQATLSETEPNDAL